MLLCFLNFLAFLSFTEGEPNQWIDTVDLSRSVFPFQLIGGTEKPKTAKQLFGPSKLFNFYEGQNLSSIFNAQPYGGLTPVTTVERLEKQTSRGETYDILLRPRQVDVHTRMFRTGWPDFKLGEVPSKLQYQVTARSKKVLDDQNGSTMGYKPKWKPVPSTQIKRRLLGTPSESPYKSVKPYSFKMNHLRNITTRKKREQSLSHTRWLTNPSYIPDMQQFIKDTGILFLDPSSTKEEVVTTLDNWTQEQTEYMAKLAKHANLIDPETFSVSGRCINEEVCGDWTYQVYLPKDHPATLKKFGWMLQLYEQLADSIFREAAHLEQRSRKLKEAYVQNEKNNKEKQKKTDKDAYSEQETKRIKEYISQCQASKCRNMMYSNRVTIDDMHQLRKAMPGVTQMMQNIQTEHIKSNALWPKRHSSNPKRPTVEDPLRSAYTYAPEVFYVRGIDTERDMKKYDDMYFTQKEINRATVAPVLVSDEQQRKERWHKGEKNRWKGTHQHGPFGTRASHNDWRGASLWIDYHKTLGYGNRGYVFGNTYNNIPPPYTTSTTTSTTSIYTGSSKEPTDTTASRHWRVLPNPAQRLPLYSRLENADIYRLDESVFVGKYSPIDGPWEHERGPYGG